MSEKLSEALLQRARQHGGDKLLEDAADALRAVEGAVPTNWCDPLLTGPNAVIGKSPYGCPDIERLLLAIRGRLLPLDAAGSAEGVS